MAKETTQTTQDPAIIDFAEINSPTESPSLVNSGEVENIVNASRDDLIQSSDTQLKNVQSDLAQSVEKQSDTEDMLTANMIAAGGEEEFRNQLSKDTGLSDMEKLLRQTDTAIAQNARRGTAAISQTIKDALGTGLTTGSLRVRLNNTQLENSIQSNLLAADSAAISNNIQAHTALVNSAVKAKFEPIKTAMEVQKFQLQRFDKAVERGDIKLSAEEKKKFNLQMGKIEKQEKEIDDIMGIAEDARKAGANSKEIGNIINSTTRGEALEHASSLGRLARMDLAIKSATLDNLRTKLQEDVVPNEQKAEVAKNKVDLLSRMSGNKLGLVESVGTTGLGRTAFTKLFGVGKADDFRAAAKTFFAKDTLDTLIDIKSRGASFGNLSDGERTAVGQSASALAGFAKTDQGGNFTGEFTGSEKIVREHIKTIQKAYEKEYIASGGEPTADMLYVQEQAQPFVVNPDGTMSIPGDQDTQSVWETALTNNNIK